jgi:ABC-type transporter Mla subunit MlaD
MLSLAVLALALAITYHARRKDTYMATLADAVAALVAEVTESTDKLDSVATFIEGVPDLVAQAVADALAAQAAGEATAAELIETARAAISDKVDEVFDAIDANTDEEVPPAI